MPANSVLPDNPQRISVVCNCGKKVVANAMPSGKRLKCPSCGQFVVVPLVRAGIVATPTRAATEPHPEAGSRRLKNVLLWIVLCSLPVGVAIGGGAFIHFNAKWGQQARIDAANIEVREAIKGADGWLKQGSAKDGENVEHRLIEAIAANAVSEKANADAVLGTVQTRRAELAADSIFDSAKTQLDAKAIDEAVALLQRYVADSRATKKPEAEQLLADCDLATSEIAALQTLMAMSDEQFVQFRNTGNLDDRKITHPVLAEIRATTLRQNIQTANQHREENKIAEANRQQEENEIAEANRQGSERLALAAVRAADDKQAAAGVWRHKPGNREPGEITLLPNGKINNPDGQDNWTLTEKTLVLRWANAKTPGGFWIDTCTVSDDGKTYRGVNQQNLPIAGWKVNPPVAAKELSAEDAAELIRAGMLGSWRWGQSDLVQTIRFAQNGTYVWRGPFGVVSRGLWRVDKDGTIRVADDGFRDEKNFSIAVRMKLNEDKISIGIGGGDGLTEVVASRFKESGMSPAEIDRYVARQIWDIRQHRGNPKLRRQAADNLKVLGPEAVAAVFDLANAVLKDVDTEVKRTAIEALGEIGMPKGIWYVRNGAQIRTIYEYDSSGAVSYAGHPAIGALVQTLLKTEDPDLGIAAEDALVKLLPTVRKRLTMDDAILLWQVQASGNKRVAPAIESAMAIFQVAQEAIAKEANKRRLQELRDAEYWAKEDERRRLAGLPTREELLLGARARREEMLSGPQESSSRGDGRVKWPDEPPYRNPLKRNANGTYNN